MPPTQSDRSEPVAPTRTRRSDARRNEQALLEAAARVFAESGIDAPVRLIAAEAGVGMGTIYRHFPSRAELVAAVYRHQVDACVDLGETLLQDDSSRFAALSEWIDAFVDFLATKHGLASVRTSDESGSGLHDYFLDRLVPICDRLLAAAREDGEVAVDVSGYELMRGIGNLCLFAGDDGRYDARKLTHLLLAGMR
ncbi:MULTISPECIES: TetR/AcrR family transcriptional regulator [unclassified Isoptericola]|uniref:TetR/AcrR family transcriptional regulator n=1 Tax=unclassified Isoptericola TaxID=2623355 RepID=UPI002712E493|nr:MULTISPECIES: TetR/AcrR family transcriptional regulator [unclassified Isoptericola]MDO8143808.1 helix-turn-helix domain-containing protein [Isoptericola sp. 178]MDO8149995.1 helix-turn-helix domain-containing protein [Isoptericola sp. b408]